MRNIWNNNRHSYPLHDNISKSNLQEKHHNNIENVLKDVKKEEASLKNKKNRVDKSPMSRQKSSVPLLIPPPLTVSQQLKTKIKKDNMKQIDSNEPVKEETIEKVEELFPELKDLEKLLTDLIEEEPQENDRQEEVEEVEDEEIDLENEENKNEYQDECEEASNTDYMKNEQLDLKNVKKYLGNKLEQTSSESNPNMDDYHTSEEEDREDFYIKNNSSDKETSVVIAKLPVLLSNVQADINISDTLKLPNTLSSITNSEWEIGKVEAKTIIPSNTLFLNGTLITTIDYIEEKGSIQSMKLEIPWEHTMNMQWEVLPDIATRDKKDYMFSSNKDLNPSFHHELFETYVEKLQYKVQKVHFVWHEELEKKVGEPTFWIKGNATLHIDILQHKFMRLRCTREGN